MQYIVPAKAQDIEEILGNDSWGRIVVRPTNEAYKKAKKKFGEYLGLCDSLVFHTSKTETAKWLGLAKKDVEEEVEKS